MLNLQPMTVDEFTAYKEWLVKDYAQDIAVTYRQPYAEVLVTAGQQIDAMTRQGLETPGQFLYNIVSTTDEGGIRLGVLWIEIDDPKKLCFINDISIYPAYRRQGWGQKVMTLLEETVKLRNVNRIELNVFANNVAAQALYHKMGYETTRMHMQKWLQD